MWLLDKCSHKIYVYSYMYVCAADNSLGVGGTDVVLGSILFTLVCVCI